MTSCGGGVSGGGAQILSHLPKLLFKPPPPGSADNHLGSGVPEEGGGDLEGPRIRVKKGKYLGGNPPLCGERCPITREKLPPRISPESQ